MKKVGEYSLIYSKSSHYLELCIFIIVSILVTLISDSYLFNPFLLVIIYLSYIRGINNYIFVVVTTIITGLIINVPYGIEIVIVNLSFFLFCLVFCFIKKEGFFKKYGPFILSNVTFIILYLIKNFNFENIINLIISFLSSCILLYGYLNLEKCLVEPSKEFEGKAKVIVLSTISILFFGINVIYLVIVRLVHVLICKISSSIEGSLAIILSCLFIYFLQNGSKLLIISLLIPSLISIFLNKKFVLPIYIFSYVIIYLYMSDKFYLEPSFYQGLISILLSLIIPNKWINKISELFNREETFEMKENNDRLEEVNENINNIINYLDIVLTTNIETNYSPIDKTISIIENKVCKDCEKRKECLLINVIKESLSGEFTKENKNIIFNDCLYPYKIIRQIRVNKITLNNEKKYHDEIKNKNDIYKQEIENIYKPLRNLFSQSEIITKKKTILIDELEAYHYKLDEISIGEDNLTFQIALQDKNEITKVMTIISNCMKKTYYLEDMFYILSLGMYQVCLSSKALFGLDKSIISYGMNGDYNGDSYLNYIENNHYYLLLSDGIGHNKNSQNVSFFMVNALNSYRKIEKDISKQITNVNTLLKTKIDEEMYATLDYIDIDLIKGEMEIFKCGSFDTYLFRNNNLFKFKSNTPPLGILYEIKTESLTKELYENDILIFMSDGYMQEPENIILEILKENYLFSSEKICSLLNEKLAKLREVEDDKTLIVIKLNKIKEFKKENQVNNLQRST